jgi:curved DNA-binding protein CbpA
MSREAFLHWVAGVDKKSYYAILRVESRATLGQLKAAFHLFALDYHPDRYADEDDEVKAAAAEVFKRGVEAYRVLSRAPLRKRYDEALARGKNRLDEKRVDTAPPPPVGKTLEDVAHTPKGKQWALKADRLLSIGKLEDARLALVNALQSEPDNAELQDRLNLVYEALALEPL